MKPFQILTLRNEIWWLHKFHSQRRLFRVTNDFHSSAERGFNGANWKVFSTEGNPSASNLERNILLGNGEAVRDSIENNEGTRDNFLFWSSFSFAGIVVGFGASLVRDSAAVMIGHYFKRRRQFVEMIVMAGEGVGIALFSVILKEGVGWAIWTIEGVGSGVRFVGEVTWKAMSFWRCYYCREKLGMREERESSYLTFLRSEAKSQVAFKLLRKSFVFDFIWIFPEFQLYCRTFCNNPQKKLLWMP